MTSIQIDGREVGPGSPVYVIAEIGSNHDGDIDQAKRLIKAAAEAGVDAVKFQAFRAKDHYSRHTPGFSYLEGSGGSTFELIQSLEIDRSWHQALSECAKGVGVDFLSSPCDDGAVEQLGELGMPAFKLASFDLPDLNLIRKMASFGVPVILSTGMADYADIERALGAIDMVPGNGGAVLLQCTSLYPAPAHLANLGAIRTMQQAFGVPVGYSDHTLGAHICHAAVALGACIVEKHFTLDRTLPGPDHPFAMEPGELAEMVAGIREIEKSFGDGRKSGPAPEEVEMFEKGRRSLHVTRKVKAGDILGDKDLKIKRPGYGISPSLRDRVVGMRVTRDVEEDYWLTWEDLK